MFGFLGTKLQKMNKGRGDLVKLENPEFESEFAVYSGDQIESRYILSSSLMERILSFKKQSALDPGNPSTSVNLEKSKFWPNKPVLIRDRKKARYFKMIQVSFIAVERY